MQSRIDTSCGINEKTQILKTNKTNEIKLVKYVKKFKQFDQQNVLIYTEKQGVLSSISDAFIA